MIVSPLVARILERCDIGDCWIWTGSTASSKNYGHVQDKSKHLYTHRVIWEGLVGPIPNGLVIDHLCEVPLCCNPDHLRVTTSRANILRTNNPTARNARKTHCKRGHAFDASNTAFRIQSNGQTARRCQTCHNAYMRERYARRDR